MVALNAAPVPCHDGAKLRPDAAAAGSGERIEHPQFGVAKADSSATGGWGGLCGVAQAY